MEKEIIVRYAWDPATWTWRMKVVFEYDLGEVTLEFQVLVDEGIDPVHYLEVPYEVEKAVEVLLDPFRPVFKLVEDEGLVELFVWEG